MAGVWREVWSGAVREAFLRGLAAHGSVRRACRETGTTTAGAYYLRRRDDDFARLWERAVARAGAECAARRAGAEARRDGMFRNYRQRHDGWTEARTRAFMRALSETACVRDACARAGISNNSAYRMRRRDADFARAWDRALAKALPTIEQAAFERAVNGWDEVVWKDGVEVSRKRRYSDALLRLLLQRRGDPETPGETKSRPLTPKQLEERAIEASKAAGGSFVARCTEAETDAVLRKHLDALKLRIERQRAGED